MTLNGELGDAGNELYVASKKSADRILEESFHSRVSNLNMRSYL